MSDKQYTLAEVLEFLLKLSDLAEENGLELEPGVGVLSVAFGLVHQGMDYMVKEFLAFLVAASKSLQHPPSLAGLQGMADSLMLNTTLSGKVIPKQIDTRDAKDVALGFAIIYKAQKVLLDALAANPITIKDVLEEASEGEIKYWGLTKEDLDAVHKIREARALKLQVDDVFAEISKNKGDSNAAN